MVIDAKGRREAAEEGREGERGWKMGIKRNERKGDGKLAFKSAPARLEKLLDLLPRN